ncbi:hypothetical protein [Labrys neptuniae]
MNNENVHTLYMHGTDLCVLCQTCGRRSLVDPYKVNAWGGKGDMTPISEVAKRFKCTTCNVKNSYAFVPPTKEFAERWRRVDITETPGVE